MILFDPDLIVKIHLSKIPLIPGLFPGKRRLSSLMAALDAAFRYLNQKFPIFPKATLQP